jgi:hypothetical protein
MVFKAIATVANRKKFFDSNWAIHFISKYIEQKTINSAMITAILSK